MINKPSYYDDSDPFAPEPGQVMYEGEATDLLALDEHVANAIYELNEAIASVNVNSPDERSVTTMLRSIAALLTPEAIYPPALQKAIKREQRWASQEPLAT